MSKNIKFFFSLILTCIFTVNIVSADIDDWLTIGGNNTNSKLNYSQTITDKNDIEAISIDGEFREPIIVNNKIYVVDSKNTNSLVVLDLNGNILERVKLAGNVGYFSRITAGDGKIFIPLKNRIQAIDIATLKSLWLTKEENGQFISSMTYYNGYVYTGIVTNANSNQSPSDGFFMAMSVEDENPNISNEIKEYTWTWGDGDETGFYWSGQAIINNSIVFLAESGELISHHLTKDIVYDTLVIPTNNANESNKTRNTIHYNKKTNTLYAATQNSKKIISIKMNNQTFDNSSYIEVQHTNQFSGGLNSDNDFLYASSGGMRANAFTVTDLNLNTIFSSNEYGTQSFPVITKPYGNSLNNDETYIYFIDYITGNLIVAKNNKKGEFKYLFTYTNSNMSNYNSNSIIVANDGSLIFPNYAGSLNILKNKKSSFSSSEMEDLISTLSFNIEYSDRDKILAIENQYNIYLENNTAVKNENILKNALTELANKKNELISKIQNDIISLSDNNFGNSEILKIRTIQTLYSSLSEDDKKDVSEITKLNDFIDEADYIEYGLKIDELISRIDTLNTKNISLYDLSEMKTLINNYNILPQKKKNSLTNYNTLINIEKKLLSLENKVKNIVNNIYDIPREVTYKDIKKLKKIIVDYNSLSSLDKQFTLETKDKTMNITNGDITYVKDCLNSIKNAKVVKGNTIYYYTLNNSYDYVLTKKSVKSNSKTTTTWYKVIAKKNRAIQKDIVINKVRTYRNTISYYSNGKTKVNAKYYKSTKNKWLKKTKLIYRSNDTKKSNVAFIYKKGIITKRVEYAYNTKGQLKSNKYGKAYQYVTTYTKKGKAVKTIRKQYTSKAKLSKKSVKVKLRTSF